MLKHKFILKLNLNWSFLAKVTNRTSLRTFSKMKNLSQIWTESYRSMDFFIKVLTSKLSFLGLKM